MAPVEAKAEYAEQLKRLLTTTVSKLPPSESGMAIINHLAALHDIVDLIKRKYQLTDFDMYVIHQELMPGIGREVLGELNAATCKDGVLNG